MAQYNALNGGTFNLQQGPGGRGFTGSFDVMTTTDANGFFTIRPPTEPA